MSETLLTIDQVQALSLSARCDYLIALPEAERYACLRALDTRAAADYIGECARRNLEEHRRAALG